MTMNFLISAEVNEEQLYKVISLIGTNVSVRLAGVDLSRNKPAPALAPPPADLRDRVLNAIPEDKSIHRGRLHKMFPKVAPATIDGHLSRMAKKGLIERIAPPGNYQRVSQQIFGELPGEAQERAQERDGAAAP